MFSWDSNHDRGIPAPNTESEGDRSEENFAGLRNRLEALWTRHYLTPEQPAVKVDVTRKTINIVGNRVFIPSTARALRLARALESRGEDAFRLYEK